MRHVPAFGYSCRPWINENAVETKEPNAAKTRNLGACIEVPQSNWQVYIVFLWYSGKVDLIALHACLGSSVSLHRSPCSLYRVS